MKRLLLILLFISINVTGQVYVSVNQDAKLMFMNDDYGNTPPTMDAVFKLGIDFNTSKNIFLTTYIQHEYANLSGGAYNRRALGIGVTVGVIRNFLFTESVNQGAIYRFGDEYYSTEVQLDIAYRLYKGLYVSLLNTYTERSEIDVWRYNAYLGLKYKLNKLK